MRINLEKLRKFYDGNTIKEFISFLSRYVAIDASNAKDEVILTFNDQNDVETKLFNMDRRANNALAHERFFSTEHFFVSMLVGPADIPPAFRIQLHKKFINRHLDDYHKEYANILSEVIEQLVKHGYNQYFLAGRGNITEIIAIGKNIFSLNDLTDSLEHVRYDQKYGRYEFLFNSKLFNNHKEVPRYRALREWGALKFNGYIFDPSVPVKPVLNILLNELICKGALSRSFLKPFALELLPNEPVQVPRSHQCVFCDPRVIRREMMSETNNFIIMPNYIPYVGTNETHFLVIPKKHIEDLSDLTEEEYAELTLLICGLSISIRAATNLGASQIVWFAQNGANAGQNISHSHIHVLPVPPIHLFFMSVFQEFALKKFATPLNAEKMQLINNRFKTVFYQYLFLQLPIRLLVMRQVYVNRFSLRHLRKVFINNPWEKKIFFEGKMINQEENGRNSHEKRIILKSQMSENDIFNYNTAFSISS